MSNSPSNWQSYSHAGWIPTTTGHMSFSNIGRNRPSVFSFNPLSDKQCADDAIVCVAQWRENRDINIFWRSLGGVRQNFFKKCGFESSKIDAFLDAWMPMYMRSFFLLVGKTHMAPIPYICDGKTTADDELDARLDPRTAIRGEITILQKTRGLKGSWRANWILRSVRTELASAGCNDRDTPAPIGITRFSRKREGRMDSFIRLGQIRGAFKAVRIDFLLFRTGEVRMMLRGGYVDEELISQAYLYLKDIAHVHHHHKAEDDQHLPLIRVSGNTDQAKDDPDDKAWRKRVLWALAKVSGQFRREDELFRRRQAAGFLAYAEAFQRVLGRIRRDGDKFRLCPEIATYDFAAQRQSIATKNEDEAWRRQGRSGIAIAAAASFISFLVLYVSLAGLVNGRFECQGGDTSGFCDYLLMRPSMALWVLGFVLLFLTYVYNTVFASRGRLNSWLKKYGRGLVLSITKTDRSLKLFSFVALGSTAMLNIWCR